MRLFVLTGGSHPYEESTPVLSRFLREAGHQVHVTDETEELLTDEFKSYDTVVFNTRREDDMTLSTEERTALTQFIGGGKGFVCLHISTCQPKDWPKYHDVTGGGWVTGTSFHPPYGQFTVNVKNRSHPGSAEIDHFVTNDELYMGINFAEDNDVFLTGDSDEGTHVWGGRPTHMPGGTFPLAWTRRYGKGRVFVTLLGHDSLSFQTTQFQRLVLNGVDWTTSKD